MIKLMNELLADIEEAPTKNDKNSVLNAHIDKYHNLGIFVNYMYSDAQWDVEIPKFTASPAPEGTSEVALMQEAKRLYVLLKESALTPKRKSEILLQILEGLHPQEAALLIKLIHNKLKIKGYTKENWDEFVQIKRKLIMDKEKAAIEKNKNPLTRKRIEDIM
jgi:hypothetical protein